MTHRELLEAGVIDLICSKTSDITVVLLAPGGYGKTTIAQRVSRSPSVRDAFPDGIYWIAATSDSNDATLTRKINDVVGLLTGRRPDLEDVHLAAQLLSETLIDRRALLVIDDIWDASILDLIQPQGTGISCLITTRDAHIAPRNARVIQVPEMSATESAHVLMDGITPDDGEMQQLFELARSARGWPVLLKVLNGRLLDDVRAGVSLGSAITEASQVLAREGLSPLLGGADDPQRALSSIVEQSVNRLPTEIADRYELLAAFPMSVDMPISVLGATWGVAEAEVDRTCRWLARVSLIQTYQRASSGARGTVTVHDVVWLVLRSLHRQQLGQLQRLLISNWQSRYGDTSPQWWRNLPRLDYFWRYLTWHLAEGEEWRLVADVVSDLGFIAGQTLVCGRLAASLELSRGTHLNPRLINIAAEFELRGHTLDALHTIADRHATIASWASFGTGPPPPRLKIGSKSHVGEMPAGAPDNDDASSLEQADLSWGVLTCTPLDAQGDQVLLGGTHNEAVIMSVCTNAIISTLQGHTDWIRSSAYDPRTKVAATASDDGTVRLWNVSSATPLQTLRGHLGAVRGCCFLEQGRLLASGSEDGTVRIWRTLDGALLHTLRHHSAPVRACTAGPDSDIVISGDDEGQVVVARVTDRGVTLLTKFSAHRGSVRALATTPETSRVASAGDDAILRLWETETGKLSREYSGHARPIRSCAVTDDAKWIATVGGDDRSVRLWPTFDAPLVTREGLRGWMMSCAFASNGTKLIAGGIDAAVHVLEVPSLETESLFQGSPDTVWAAIASSTSPSVVLVGGIDGAIWSHDLRRDASRLVGRHEATVRAMDMDPSGEVLVTASDDTRCASWDLAADSVMATYGQHDASLRSVSVHPDGRSVVSADQSGSIGLWSLRDGSSLATLPKSSSKSTVAAFWGDVGYVTADADGVISVFDRPGAKARVVEIHSSVTNLLVVGSSRNLAVMGTESGGLYLLDLLTETLVSRVDAHTQWVSRTAFLSEKNILVSVSDDRTVRAWTLEDGLQPLCGIAVDQPLYAVAWSSGLNRIIAGGPGGLYQVEMGLEVE